MPEPLRHLVRYAPYRWLLGGSAVNTVANSTAPIASAVLHAGGSTAELGLVVAA